MRTESMSLQEFAETVREELDRVFSPGYMGVTPMMQPVEKIMEDPAFRAVVIKRPETYTVSVTNKSLLHRILTITYPSSDIFLCGGPEGLSRMECITIIVRSRESEERE